MRFRTCFPLLLAVALVAGCAGQETLDRDVRVTLNDGQVLVGEMTTSTFTLKTAFGMMAFDAAQAGELGPVEGDDVDPSDLAVRLWLRNGSEFVGRWEKPSVTLALTLGGEPLRVDVPIAKIKRLQFKGDDVWSDEPVFRVITASGDDFFVDVTKTQVSLETDIFSVRPFLSEIRHLQPRKKEEGVWRVHLENGSLLNARMAQKEIAFRLAMGPERVNVPLESIQVMARQRVHPSGSASRGSRPPSSGVYFNDESDGDLMHRASEARLESYGKGGYYSNARQKVAKKTALQQWEQTQKK